MEFIKNLYWISRSLYLESMRFNFAAFLRDYWFFNVYSYTQNLCLNRHHLKVCSAIAKCRACDLNLLYRHSISLTIDFTCIG